MSEYIYEHKPSGADHMGKPVELPTLVQREEIVRCRDCKHYDRFNARCKKFGIDCYLADPQVSDLPGHEYTFGDYGFCAWGERKEGGERNSEPFVEYAARVAKELHDEAFALLEGCDEPDFSAIDAICGMCADMAIVAERWSRSKRKEGGE